MSDLYVARLVQYGLESGLIPEEERIYSTNQILEVMKKDDYEAPTVEEVGTEIDLADTLNHLLDEALENGVLEDGGVVSRDLFDTKLMNCLTPRPAQVIAKFRKDYAEDPKKATDNYYNFSVATNYIRKDRIAKDRRWKVPSEYGEIDITINLSKPEKDPKAIAAAKLANADGFIRMLPNGYDTVLSGDGSGLSQGQRQLISIARAAVADPPVMILDEATSSIDTRTEAIVQRGMDALMKGRTVFVIAHRLSTVQNSDVIMVLEQGHIIERGSHDKLIEEKGKYYQLYTGAFELE